MTRPSATRSLGISHTLARAALTLGLAAPAAALGGACGGSSHSQPMTLGGRVVDVQTLDRGKDLYLRYCATCHGMDGKAQTSQARNLDPQPRDFTAAHFKHKASPGDALPSDDEVGRVIRNGVPGTGMPPWPNLDDKDLDAVIQYLKTFSPRWQTEAPAPAGAPAQPTTPAAPTSGQAPERPGTLLAGLSIDTGHHPIAQASDDRFEGARFVLPARHDTVSFRAASPGCQTSLAPSPTGGLGSSGIAALGAPR